MQPLNTNMHLVNMDEFINIKLMVTRVDVLTALSDKHRNSRLIQRFKQIFQNVSDLITDANCKNFNRNHCFRAKTPMIKVITQ